MVTNLAPQKTQQAYRFSRFQLAHVSQSTLIIAHDVCKETCKTPTPPNTCKLECHSGSPFTDMWEELPELVIC